jgi:hypothetical protein
MRQEAQTRTFATKYSATENGVLQVYMVDYLPVYFDTPEDMGVATLTDTNGNVQRTDIASTGSAEFNYFMAAQKSRQIVTAPLSYFPETEDSYSANVSANEDRTVQIMNTLKLRYVIFRFISEAV